jgi:hypothetical protein
MNPTAPLRLRDDPRAPRLARGDLALAAQTGAGDFDAARALAVFEAATAPANPVTPRSPTAPPPTGTLAGALAKGAICGLLVVGGTGLWSILGDARGAQGDARARPAIALSGAPERQPVTPPVIAEEAPPPVVSPPTPPPPSPRAQPLVSTPHPVAAPPPTPEATRPPDPAPVTPSATVSGASELRQEMELLARLRAIEPSDPRQALALAEEGQRRFSSGFYAQERETLAISALARLGRRGEAAARARAFVAAYPRSLFVERIREITGE